MPHESVYLQSKALKHRTEMGLLHVIRVLWHQWLSVQIWQVQSCELLHISDRVTSSCPLQPSIHTSKLRREILLGKKQCLYFSCLSAVEILIWLATFTYSKKWQDFFWKKLWEAIEHSEWNWTKRHMYNPNCLNPSHSSFPWLGIKSFFLSMILLLTFSTLQNTGISSSSWLLG